MTNLEDLKDAWCAQSGMPAERFEQIAMKVKRGSDLFRQAIFRRDLAETLASLIVIAFFAPGIFNAKDTVAQLGFGILTGVGTLIPMVLWWTRRRPATRSSVPDFIDFVALEIDQLKRQVWLLRNVAWWGLVPMYAGILLLFVGFWRGHETTVEIVLAVVYLSLSAGLFIYIWSLNQRWRKKHLEPLLKYYTRMHDALVSGEDFEGAGQGPPTEFLCGPEPKTITRRWVWIWITLAVVAFLIVAGYGYHLMQSFDSRTGKFVIATGPVVAALLIYISGVGRYKMR